MKRILILFLILLFTTLPARAKVSTYDVLERMNAELIDRFRAAELTDDIIRGFMDEMDDEASKLSSAVMKSTAEQFFIQIFATLIAQDEYIDILLALDTYFSDEIEYMVEYGKVPPSFELFFLSVMSDFIIDDSLYGNSHNSEGNIRNEDISLNPVTEPEPPEPPEPPIFTDLDEYDWAKPFIRHLYDAGYINGYEDGSFHPSDSITRAELLKIAVSCFLNQRYKENQSVFQDVNDGDWFYEQLLTAEYFSLFGEIYKDNFYPPAPITRQEMCAVLYRCVRRTDKELPQLASAYDFVDVAEFSNYAYDPIKELQKAGVIQGEGENKFNPRGTATRAEAAKIISILLQMK